MPRSWSPRYKHRMNETPIDPDMARLDLTTFIVRTCRDRAGRVSGVIEAVRTHRKERFEDLEAIGGLIAQMTPIASREQESPR